MSNLMNLADQVDRLVNENTNLRNKSISDDETIELMKNQYDELAAQVEGLRDRAERDVAEARNWAQRVVGNLTIERDQAVRAKAEIKTLLLQSAALVTQALRADIGDTTPNPIPDRKLQVVTDDRLPAARIA